MSVLGKVSTAAMTTRQRQLKLAQVRVSAQSQRLRLLLLVDDPAAHIESNPNDMATASQGGSHVVRVGLYDFSIDRKRFQNRVDAHSKESEDRIVRAVLDGSFSWGLFDPILLWREPKTGELFLLSGHSRRAAFVNLSELLGRREFATIPAKIVSVSEAEAIRLARSSNTLSTKESFPERASYYRQRRAEGVTRKEIETEAATNEGRNASVVLPLSFLNPTGEALDLIRATQGSEVTGAQNALTLGTWLGEARRRYPELTNAHESELYDWLREGAYGTKPGQISSKQAFIDRVSALILKNTVWGAFETSQPLNPLGRASKSSVEVEQDQAEQQARQAVADAEKIYKEKLSDYSAREKDRATLERVLAPYHQAIRAAQITLQQVIARRDTVKQALRSQVSLFGLDRGDALPEYGIERVDYIDAKRAGMVTRERSTGLGRTTTPDAVRVDIYQKITDKLVAIIEKGDLLPWLKRYDGNKSHYANLPVTARHINLATRNAYRGINDFLLSLTNYVTGKDNKVWLTYKQAESLGGQVRKGAEGTAVCFYTNDLMRNAQKKTMMRSKWEKLAPAQQAEWEPSWTLKGYTVFSVDQIDGLESVLGPLVSNPPRSNAQKIDSCEAIVNAMPLRPLIADDGGDRAFYRPSTDSVHLPEMGYFHEDAYYYGTLFHELIHATAHPTRLNRELGETFGDPKYAFEELIAELGASFLGSEAGILHWRLKNTAAYLQGWQQTLIRHFKEDKKFIFQAAAKAQKAADFVLGVLPVNELPVISAVPAPTPVVIDAYERSRHLQLIKIRASAQSQRLRLLALTNA